MTHSPHTAKTRCGYVAMVSKPNVGKSTLLNALLGWKIAAVANKPQTTWQNIRGILTERNAQIVFIDTPGIHLGRKSLLNRALNENARWALNNVDIILYLIDSESLGDEDRHIIRLIKKSASPCILGINKTDLYEPKERLLPIIERLNNEHLFDAIVPISAKTGDNLVALKNEIHNRLPISDYHFPEDQFSDRSVRFLVSEFIREQVVRFMGDELPYSVYVDVEQYTDRPDVVEISAIIWVAKTSQKPMLIGKRGITLKKIGSLARKPIEKLVGKRVFLSLWVKEKLGWQNNPKIIASFDSTW